MTDKFSLNGHCIGCHEGNIQKTGGVPGAFLYKLAHVVTFKSGNFKQQHVSSKGADQVPNSQSSLAFFDQSFGNFFLRNTHNFVVVQ
jgi:hypothetical protein